MKKRRVASFPSGYDLVTPGDLNAARTTHPLHPYLFRWFFPLFCGLYHCR